MKKKQLLAESEIRQFMKFANIGSLANPFVDRMNETYEMGLTEQDEEDDLEAEDPGLEGGMTDPEAPMSVDPDAAGEEAVEAEPAAGGDTDAALQGVMDAVEAMKLGFVEKGMPEVADAIGLSATGDDEMEMGDDVDVSPEAEEAEAGAPPAPPEVPGMEAAPEEPADELEEADIYLEDDGNIVNEVARRVARRLLEGRRKRRR